jgi:hypothetical protein
MGSSVGPRVGLGHMEKRKFLSPPGLELRPLDRLARSYKHSDTLLKGANISLSPNFAQLQPADHGYLKRKISRQGALCHVTFMQSSNKHDRFA